LATKIIGSIPVQQSCVGQPIPKGNENTLVRSLSTTVDKKERREREKEKEKRKEKRKKKKKKEKERRKLRWKMKKGKKGNGLSPSHQCHKKPQEKHT